MKKELWTTSEAAGFLDVKPNTLVKWRQREEGPPFVKIGSNVRYREADIRAWLEGNRVLPPTFSTLGVR